MPTAKNSTFISNEPIENPDQDQLNFLPYAEKVQRIIQNQNTADDTSPLTIGIYGKWGEGKTSFLNLIKKGIDFKKNNGQRILIYDFNPWRYTTEDEMLHAFFDGLAQFMILKIEDNLREAGKYILKFSRYLKAVKLSASVGIPVEGATKVSFEPSQIFEALGEDLKGEELSLEAFKDKIDEALKKKKYKVLITIDDLDRLDKDEVYAMLKLIKLNASFSNVLYLVAMDPEQIAKAIQGRYGNTIEDGYAYLEKIINIPIHVPRVDSLGLKKIFEAGLWNVFNRIYNETNDKIKREEIQDIIDGYDLNELKTPRETARILNGFFIAMFSIGDKVNLRDLYWVEYLKIKKPKYYNYLKDINDYGSEIICVKNNLFDDDRNTRDIINNILFAEKRDYLTDTIENEIKRNKRINHIEYFNKYFTYSDSEAELIENKIRLLINAFKNKEVLRGEFILKEILREDRKRAVSRIFRKIEADVTILTESEIESIINELIRNKDFFREEKKELIGQIGGFFARLEFEKRLNGNLLIFKFYEKLDCFEAYDYINKFKKADGVGDILKEMYLKKINEFKEKSSFLNESIDSYNIVEIFRLWCRIDRESFKVYLMSEIKNVKDVKVFIKHFNFAHNESRYFRQITNECYTEIDEIIAKEVIGKMYNIVRGEYPEITEDIISSWISKREYTLDDNILQFIKFCEDDNYEIKDVSHNN